MTSQLEICFSEREELIQVHRDCPERPYIELLIPEIATAVTSIKITVLSRDQGWSDTREVSYTWIYALVSRPNGRPPLRKRHIVNNVLANSEFHEHRIHWRGTDLGNDGLWIRRLRAGDTVQLIPQACYPAWVNFVKKCRLEVEYVKEHSIDIGVSVKPAHPANYDHLFPILDRDRQEIRLLIVDEGSFNDDIKCRFRTISLDTSRSELVPFDALSYCWDTTSPRKELNFEHVYPTSGISKTTPFLVGSNVEAAIRRLRRETTSLNIWIDAICVNQEDLAERSQQVSLMRNIYSQAEIVHVWLGESNVPLEASLRLVRDIYNFNFRICPGGEECLCEGTSHSSNPQPFSDQTRSFKGIHECFRLAEQAFSHEVREFTRAENRAHRVYNTMDWIFSDPWFTRSRVLQEVSLARNALVHCAKETVPWKEIVAMDAWLGDSEFTRLEPHVQYSCSLSPIWSKVGQIMHSSPSATSNDRAVDENRQPLLDLFLHALDLKSSDPRDRLFALQSLAKETSGADQLDELIRPNYTKSIERVFADFTRWWIQTYRSLGILSSIHCQTDRTWQSMTGPRALPKDTVKLPTWALSAEGNTNWIKATMESQFDFRACGEEGIDFVLLQTQPDPQILRLSGFVVSQITAIGYPSFQPISNSEKISMNDTCQHGEVMFEVFDKVLDPCGAAGFWTVRATEHWSGMEYRDHINAHWGYYRPSREDFPILIPPGMTAQESYPLPTCLHQFFCVTINGLYGLCPWTAKEGDLVVLLTGANVPYLLRSVVKQEGQEGSDDEEFYQLVGECYIDGIMFGEFFRGDDQEGFRQRRTFNLI